LNLKYLKLGFNTYTKNPIPTDRQKSVLPNLISTLRKLTEMIYPTHLKKQ